MYHLDIEYVQEFIVLADAMSFVRAAERLFISQSTLSRHISALEAQLGVQLIERNTRIVYLTEAGIALYRDFVKLVETVRRIYEHTEDFSSGYTGRLRINAPSWIMRYLDPMILEFSRHNQKIRIELSMGDFMDGQTQLQRRTTDICVIEGKPLSSDEWEYVKLVDERLCAVMSAANPLARLKSVTFQELQGERIILFEANNTDDSGYADKRYTQLAGEVPTSGVFQKTVVLRQLLSDHGINPTQYLFLDSLDMLPLTIQQKNAVCLLMQSIGNMGRNYLVSVPISDGDALLPMYLCARRDDPQGIVKAFFDIVSAGQVRKTITSVDTEYPSFDD